MSRIIPVIMVSKSLLERLEKARAGLVQRRTWVNNSPSTKGHYRMQWVALGPSAGKEKDYSKQRDLFGEPEPFEKPAPKAGLEDVRKMSDDALDAEHLKLFPKFNEVQKLKGYRYQEDHEKVMPYSDYQRMRDVMNEMLRRSEIERENLKEYPGLTKDETWFIISTKKMIDKMKKQNGGEISPEKLKDMSHMINWMHKLESKIKEPEKTVEEKNLEKEEKPVPEAEPSGENKAYPGLTNKEIMELITSRNTLGLMEKQYKGSVAPRVKREMSALQDRIRGLESKIREPEKPAEKPAKEEKTKAGDYKIYHDADMPLTEQYARRGAVNAKADGMWVDFFNKDGKKIGSKKVGDSAEAREEAQAFNWDHAEDKPEGKKPFEDMTFKERNKPGLPENVAETVRDVLGVSSGTAANYAGSNKYDDIDKFKYAAAKWAYENDKVGSASDILDQYARHKGIRKSILDTFRDGLAKAFGGR